LPEEKGEKMNITTNRNLLKEAIDNGCKTAAELAHYLKVRTMAARAYRRA